jgi:tRNA (guanine37-N1)-methyltransferase
MLHIHILTLFPRMFRGPFDESIIKRAIERKLAAVTYINIRDYANDPYKSVDDHPYGGGQGMIMRVDIIDRALSDIKKCCSNGKTHIILLDPQGTPYRQSKANELTTFEHLILICGHYEAVDERIRSLVDEEISVGDYILTGGEIPAMIVTDSVIRLLPGVLKRANATVEESFSDALLEHPQYTKPENYKGHKVPSVLLSGDHNKIHAWRKSQAEKRTALRRPDLLLHN